MELRKKAGQSREQKSQKTAVHAGMTSQEWKISGRKEKGNQKLARNSISQNISDNIVGFLER